MKRSSSQAFGTGGQGQAPLTNQPNQNNQPTDQQYQYVGQIAGFEENEGQGQASDQPVDYGEFRGYAESYRSYLLQNCQRDKLPAYVTQDLPADDMAMMAVYGQIYQYYHSREAQLAWVAQPEKEPEPQEKPDPQEEPEPQKKPEKETKSVAPISTDLPKIIIQELDGLIYPKSEGSKPARAMKLTADCDKSAIDWKRSRQLMLQTFNSFTVMGDRQGLWNRVSRWNAFAPDDMQINLKEAGLSEDFQPQAGVAQDDRQADAPLTQTFNLLGASHILTERGGVKGGFNAIFDAPPAVTKWCGCPVLIRAPREDARQAAAAGMANYKTVSQNFAVPKVYNNPADDGFYIVEKIGGDFDLQNEKHIKAVARAFRLMTEGGERFPFDLRPDNIKFDGDKLVVIDFSESGGLGGDVGFWKDSLLEFCWRGPNARISGKRDNSRPQQILEWLIADAIKRSALPKTMSREPSAYDPMVLMAILDGLPGQQRAMLLPEGL